MNLSFWQLLKILLEGKNTLIFLFFTILGLSFSMGVILCNFGLMDGYEIILKEGLRKNSSDLEITSRYGFFSIDKTFREAIDQERIERFAGVIRTEGFLIANQKSKGVLVNGVVAEDFKNVSALEIEFKTTDGIIIGSALAKELNVKAGDWVVLAFTRGNQNIDDLPYLNRVQIEKVVTHGIYKKDLRILYMPLSALEKFANTEDRVNTVLIKLEGVTESELINVENRLEASLGFGYQVKPYWSGFKTLIDAVKVEKFSITIILQLIIVIGLFNIVAFINFNTIKKSQEFFMLRALGVSSKAIQRFWVGLIILIWFLSCLLSLVMTMFIDQVVLKLPILKLPGSIYELDHLSLHLNPSGVLIVFALTFIWSVGVILFILWRERRKSILAGLRQRFA